MSDRIAHADGVYSDDDHRKAAAEGLVWDPVGVAYVRPGGSRTVKVAAGTQIAHDGKLYGPGEAVEASDAEASAWIANGWAAPVERKAR